MADVFFWTRHGKYGYCSNFYRSLIEVEGEVYPTVEHYYQASKTFIPEEHEMVRSLRTPTQAKLAGGHVTLRRGWDAVRADVMLIGLRAKFAQHPDLAEKLLSTGDVCLHENSPWDRFWGYAKGTGLDMLGKLLMQVRDELRGAR